MGAEGFFRGELVELRAIDREHLPTYARWMRDPEVKQTLATALMPVTMDDEEAWYRSVVADERNHAFGIHLLDDGRLIGNCSLRTRDPRHRGAEFGIVIGEKDCWGKGYGTDALRICCRVGFDELNLHRIHLYVFDFNERGRRAYARAGFREEGRLRESIWRNGRWHDMYVMSMLEQEWRQR